MKPSTRFSWILIVLLVASLAGCKSLLKKRVPVTAPSDSAPIAVVAPPASAPPPVLPAPAPVDSAPAVAEDDSIPSPEDFEDEAFERVTSANFKAEFARLQKEVNAK